MPQAPRQIVQFWRLCRQGASAEWRLPPRGSLS